MRMVLLLGMIFLVQHGWAQEGAPPPRWLLSEIKSMTARGGRWIADNSEYQSDQEPYEAYVVVWTASAGGYSMRGRMFGMRAGQETPNLWEYRQYWHPGQRSVVIEQFGWGVTVGIGTVWQEGQQTKSQQTFYRPGASPKEQGHSSNFLDQDTHVTESYSIDGDTWVMDRRYTWIRDTNESKQ